MKYYLHDSNSFSDEKITELYLNFGYEGLGLFYTTLEKLASQEKPIKTNVLKSQLNVGKKLNKCWDFMESLGILSSNNGETFSKQLLNFSEKYQIKKEKNKEKIKQWRENQSNTENVTSYEPSCNPPKVKLSKVKESKVNNISDFSFKKSLSDLGVNENLINDWLLVRKNKKATNSETAFNLLRSEFESSGLEINEILKICVLNSWSGFKKEWLKNISSVQNNQNNGSKFDKIVESVNNAHDEIRAKYSNPNS